MTLAIQNGYAPHHKAPRQPRTPGWRAIAFQHALGTALSVVYAAGRPTALIFREYWLGIIGFGCIDAAAFVHSLFWGLLVTGVSVLLVEIRAMRGNAS